MIAILGISAFYHDSAAALIVDGKIIAAAQEERFTRKKHDPGYPSKAIDYVLSEGCLTLDQVEFVVFYDKPFLKFERLLETYIAYAPKGLKSFSMAMPIWLREKLFLKDQLIKEMKLLDKKFDEEKLLFSEHHFSHAASAYFPSPFDKALVLTLDGVGEWATATVAIGDGNKLDVVKEIHFPHSLGLLYSAFTYYLGFKVNSGEYKVMGLAPYGRPVYKELILEKLLDLKEDGSFCLDQSYFNYATGLTMTNKKFSNLFGMPVRNPESDDLTPFHMDIAASVQSVTEDVVIKITRSLFKEYGISNLCMAGGVALNCVANGKILRDGVFDNVWIQPAAGDAGGALGAALAVWYKELGHRRDACSGDSMSGSFLGPSYTQAQIEDSLSMLGAIYKTESEEVVLEQTAKAISKGMAVGWFHGRMEFGPRSLGARSIIADPRSEKTQKNLNLKVKFRESFRPFAPSVLSEDVNLYFDIQRDSPYMLFVADVLDDLRKPVSESDEEKFGIEKLNIIRSEIPAVTHVDYSARVQTVHASTNPRFHSLISKFKEMTGCSVLVNTSFNIRGEPVVSSPEDAFNCFMGTGLDMLVIGNSILYKIDQVEAPDLDYKDRFDLD